MADILKACEGLEVSEVPAGAELIREGEEQDRFFILIEGAVSVRKGGVEVARIGDPGAVFGEISALLSIPASATVTTSRPTRFYVAKGAAEFIESRPQIAVHTARILAQRLYDATAYLADIKAQFQDQADHFGMMDTILASLLENQTPGARPAAVEDDSTRPKDPRL